MKPIKITAISKPATAWERLGQVMERGKPGDFDSSVTGDPCIVWDNERACYHMFYFAQNHEGGKEINCDAHAISSGGIGAGVWQKQGPLIYSNPGDLFGNTHKPWILMDPHHPNQAVRVDGKYWLFTVSWRGPHKVIQGAMADSLDGPWQVIHEPIVDVGDEYAFDGYHVDAVSAYWFEQQKEILIYYMGYPLHPQSDQPNSPYGASNAVAVLRPGERTAQKLGKTVRPSPNSIHWTAGYVGGLQIFPAVQGGWYGILNASPTPPASINKEPTMREPAPSLGGWAYTPEDFPIKGWQAMEEPIEWINDIPEQALKAGEGVNLWRHHIVIVPDHSMYLLYNTGSYSNERMFGRFIPTKESPVVMMDEEVKH